MRRIRHTTAVMALLAAVVIGGLAGRGNAYELELNNRYGLDPELYGLWSRADKHFSQPIALDIADTLMQRSRQKGNTIGQCLALEIPIDYYNSQLYIDMNKLREAVGRQRNFALFSADAQDFVFTGWSKLITRYITRYDFDNALKEAGIYKQTAERLENDYGYVRACLLFGRIYAKMGNDSLAIVHLRDGISHAETLGDGNQIFDLYSDITERFVKTGQKDSALYYIDKINSSPDATNASKLNSLYQKSMLDARGRDYEELLRDIKLYRQLLRKQTYSHTHYKGLLHEMFSKYLMTQKLYDRALTECDSITDIDTKIQAKIQIYEAEENWEKAYGMYLKLDTITKERNERNTALYSHQQDSLLRISNTERERLAAETENAAYITRQKELQLRNSRMSTQKIHNENILRARQSEQARLANKNNSLKIEENKAKLENAEAARKMYAVRAETARRSSEQQSRIVKTVFAVIVAIGICEAIYLRYRRVTLRALQSEHDAAVRTEKEKIDIIHNIRHEIRTPLNSISGFTDLLSMSDEMELSEEEKSQYVGYIQQNAMTLHDIVVNMIELSKIEHYETMATLSYATVGGIAGGALDSMRHLLKPGVEVINRVGRTGTPILTDPKMLAQVWENLISNACKYTTEGEIILDCSDRGDQWEFSVSDTGPGIPANKADDVFNMFEKLGSLTSGAGLGLTMSRAIMSRLGGRIEVDTGYTSGCRVVFTLPKQPDGATVGGSGSTQTKTTAA